MIYGKKLDIFQERLACSGIEASALRQKGETFADELAELRGLYSVELYDLSWKIKGELEIFPREPKGTFQQLKHKASLAKLKGKISGNLKAMWETAVAARQIEQELFYALEMYDLPIHKDDYITTLLEALNEAGQMSNPVAVSDGREIYENLAFKSGVIRPLGFQPELHETIESRYYYTYERKR